MKIMIFDTVIKNVPNAKKSRTETIPKLICILQIENVKISNLPLKN